jgi:hypothetical protein
MARIPATTGTFRVWCKKRGTHLAGGRGAGVNPEAARSIVTLEAILRRSRFTPLEKARLRELAAKYPEGRPPAPSADALTLPLFPREEGAPVAGDTGRF